MSSTCHAAFDRYDEPVYNADFLAVAGLENYFHNAGEFSAWEVDFLNLIDFDTRVSMAEYTDCARARRLPHALALERCAHMWSVDRPRGMRSPPLAPPANGSDPCTRAAATTVPPPRSPFVPHLPDPLACQ